MISIDLQTNEIVPLPPMISARIDPAAAIINDSIYVLGGGTEEDDVIYPMRTAEKYELKTLNRIIVHHK